MPVEWRPPGAGMGTVDLRELSGDQFVIHFGGASHERRRVHVRQLPGRVRRHDPRGGTDKASSSAASDRSSGGSAGNSERNTFNSDRGSNHDKSERGARYGRYAYGACTNFHRVHTSHGWVRVCIR